MLVFCEICGMLPFSRTAEVQRLVYSSFSRLSLKNTAQIISLVAEHGMRISASNTK